MSVSLPCAEQARLRIHIAVANSGIAVGDNVPNPIPTASAHIAAAIPAARQINGDSRPTAESSGKSQPSSRWAVPDRAIAPMAATIAGRSHDRELNRRPPDPGL